MTTSATSKALHLQVLAKCTTSKARASVMSLCHAKVNTPVFMPVGTQGTLKGMTVDQLEDLDCRIILGNTYHLGHRPGPEVMKKAGGLHSFMKWDRALLTDSGGFQMVSLLELSQVTEEGVSFKSPHDDTMMLLTPEHSIDIQNTLGSDIMMQLDDVISSCTSGPRVEEAMHRSIRWLDRCIKANKNPHSQNLFAIIQGGLDTSLRQKCCDEMTKRDVPGFAIGGLSGGESKNEFWKIVTLCTDLLPKEKPVYLMGVGFAVDLVVCVALGCDMFDCVFPTRTARFGTALVPSGQLKLTKQIFAKDYRPIDEECKCSTCKSYSRAYLHTIATKEPLACSLITVHNVSYQLNLMSDMRSSIIEDKFPHFVKQFFKKLFPNENYPSWAIDALNSVNIHLT